MVGFYTGQKRISQPKPSNSTEESNAMIRNLLCDCLTVYIHACGCGQHVTLNTFTFCLFHIENPDIKTASHESTQTITIETK